MSVPLPPRSQPKLRDYIERPWTSAARRSPAARAWCEKHGYVTPHFSWKEMGCTDGTDVPVRLRGNTARLCWALERFRHRLGDVSMTVDGPFRTPEKNRAVGGASLSRHVQADAADFYVTQVEAWIRQSKKLKTKYQVLAYAYLYFRGVGNETSGTLHVDMRPGARVRFTTWRAGR